jgi:anti-anti-sigma factor
MDVLSYGPGRYAQPISAAVRGEVDLSTADDLLLRLRMLAGTATGEIALDLSQVTFIDCAGLQALIALDHHVRTAGGRVRVTAVSPQVARLFELVRLHGERHDILAPPALTALRRATAPDDARALSFARGETLLWRGDLAMASAGGHASSMTTAGH